MSRSADRQLTEAEIRSFIRENYLKMSDNEIAEELSLTYKMVKGRRQKMCLFKESGKQFSSSDDGSSPGAINRILKMLEDSGIPPNEIAVDKIRLSNRSHVNKETGLETETSTHNVTIAVEPEWAGGPEWPVVQQAPSSTKKFKTVKSRKTKSKVALVLPDPQIGYRRYEDFSAELDPFHDEEAMAVGLEIAKDIDPDVIVNLGDFLDLAPFSKFVQEPAFAMTTQATINRGYDFLVQQKEAAPNADVILIEGNHDKRLHDLIMRNAQAAFGLKRANLPEDWPVMSIPHLMRLDELGVEYIEGYPAGEYYINDRLKCIHGKVTSSTRGRSAAKIANDEYVSTITGHTHKLEMSCKTLNTKHGPHVNMGLTLGSLCRTDGAVPATNSAITSSGKVVPLHMDWQQCVGVVYYEEGDAPFSVTPVVIHEGSAMFEGKNYSVR